MFISGIDTATSYSLRMLADSMHALQKSVARLSSGSRIASIADDPAGAAISIKFDAEISRIGAARSNLSIRNHCRCRGMGVVVRSQIDMGSHHGANAANANRNNAINLIIDYG